MDLWPHRGRTKLWGEIMRCCVSENGPVLFLSFFSSSSSGYFDQSLEI